LPGTLYRNGDPYKKRDVILIDISPVGRFGTGRAVWDKSNYKVGVAMQ
jgi:hypothetical protein